MGGISSTVERSVSITIVSSVGRNVSIGSPFMFN
jgi:hypothetical protein